MKAAGCSDFQLGIEHGNEEFRKKYLNRQGSNEVILKACDILEKYQLPYTVNNIIGWPDETRELIFDTIDLNRKINPKTANVYMMTPYKGTEIRKYCEEEGILGVDARTKQLLGGSDIRYKYISRSELMGLQRTFPMYVKFDKGWWPSIRMAENFGVIGNRIYDRLREKYIEEFYK